MKYTHSLSTTKFNIHTVAACDVTKVVLREVLKIYYYLQRLLTSNLFSYFDKINVKSGLFEKHIPEQNKQSFTR